MIRFLRALIGTLWGAIVGIFAIHLFGKAFDYDAVICGMAFGFPVLFGLYGGLRNNRWNGFWKITLCPISALFLLAFILYSLFCIAIFDLNIWHCAWVMPNFFALIYSVKKIISLCFKNL